MPGLNACLNAHIHSTSIYLSETSANEHKYFHQGKSINWTNICMTCATLSCFVNMELFCQNRKQMRWLQII